MESITLTASELLRLRTIQRVLDHGLSTGAAAEVLDLSTRQVKRLLTRLRDHGPSGLASRRRGCRPNNALDRDLRRTIIDLARTTYQDFGPTLLAEKLREHHAITVSRETVRTLLVAEGLHRARRRRLHPRPPRARRPCFGELLQADGSPHRWFEYRAVSCCLLLVNDDATSRIMAARFAPSETTNAYFELFRECFVQHGRPLAIYTDKNSVFRASTGEGETQVQRALRELDIELICANSPQAKGRIERANRTLQDRLVKELRLRNICTVDDANAFLPEFIADFNRRFAKPPLLDTNVHRPIDPTVLDFALSRRFERKLTKNLVFQLNDQLYAVAPSGVHRLRTGMCIDVIERKDGTIASFWKGCELTLRPLGKRHRGTPVVSSQELNERVDRRHPDPRKAHVPPMSHPWKRKSFLLTQTR